MFKGCVIFFVKFYQKLISPFFISSCRFTPTCSEYTIMAFRKYHFLKALIISVKRILSCHPWHPGGHDPLP
ncbi:MAG: membrane protein insertion efficiency factor YidD [Methylophilaceae bacterium]